MARSAVESARGAGAGLWLEAEGMGYRSPRPRQICAVLAVAAEDPSTHKPIDPFSEGARWLIAFVRRNLVPLLFAPLVVLQFLTWRASVNIHIPEPCGKTYYSPCHPTADEIASALAKE